VVVVVHQAVRMAHPRETFDDTGQHPHKRLAVLVVLANAFASVAAARHMVQRARKLDAEWSGHTLTLHYATL